MLFDLEKDPFELENLAHKKTRIGNKLMKLINDMNRYVFDQIGKDFKYPLQGKLSDTGFGCLMILLQDIKTKHGIIY